MSTFTPCCDCAENNRDDVRAWWITWRLALRQSDLVVVAVFTVEGRKARAAMMAQDHMMKWSNVTTDVLGLLDAVDPNDMLSKYLILFRVCTELVKYVERICISCALATMNRCL